MTKTIATHDGQYHLDDVFAAAILYGIDKDITVIRSRKPEDWAKAEIVFDVGGGKYDHHFVGAEKRAESGITYSSCGLIWRDFGRDMLAKMNVAPEVIDQIWQSWDNLIAKIDAADNGEGNDLNNGLSLTSIVSSFNGVKSFNEAFLYVFEFISAKTLGMNKGCADVAVVRNALAERTNPLYVILPEKDIRWQGVVCNEAPECLFVVYENKEAKNWCVTCAPITPGSFQTKLPLPANLCGLPPDELLEKTKRNITFVHKNGFFACAEQYDDIMFLMQLSLAAQKEEIE